MQKRPLNVTLHATETSVVDLTVADPVQLDRVVLTADGDIVGERMGPLIQPGTTRIALDPGVYGFKTMSDAELAVVVGGVTATAGGDTKDPVPDPPPRALPGLGDEPTGDAPRLSVGRAR